MSQPLWTPEPERARSSDLERFRRAAERAGGRDLGDYHALHAWSVEEPATFWGELWRFLSLTAAEQPTGALADGAKMPGARFFPGAKLNFAENLLGGRGPAPAVVFRREDGLRRELSRDELHAQAAALAAALRAEGVGPGDRVAGFLPNCPETVIAMLAASSIGAVWSSCSPDFGRNGVLERFGQIEPTVLLTADAYLYGGKRCDSLATAREVAESLEGLRRVVVVPFVDRAPDIAGLPRAALWADYLESGAAPEFAPLPFDHPLYIMYSSGTTGAPKCIVHGAGGTLVQQLKEHRLHVDLRPGERIFYFTTCGWMMWNWLVAALAAEATIVLYDGSPFHPDGGVLWRLAEEESVDVFGTSAKYISAQESAGMRPGRDFDLSGVRSILSTGSPLAPASFDYVYEAISDEVQLASISGGTDILGCFAGGCPLLPVWRGELQCRLLGMAVEIFDDQGRPVTGEKGELVCTRPFPSMPVGFWNDPDGARYRDAYFSRYPDVWAHGDYAEITGHGGVIIHGRSDTVLNPGGVRIGTAEIYRQLELVDEIVDSVAVGQRRGDDERVVLFVVPAEGVSLDEALRARIRRLIRENATPRHVPAKILAAADIPRTLSGKISELAVRAVIHGEPVKNTDALANPEALDEFRGRAELEED